MVQVSASKDSKDSSKYPARIKVIGVGGGGCNSVRRLIAAGGVPGVSCAVVNTDTKALQDMGAVQVIQIGEELTRGLGAGGNLNIGAKAAVESRSHISKIVSGADLVFITAGMGGGTGTGASPEIAKMAKATGALVVAVVTTPFGFEGRKRLEDAMTGLGRLRSSVDNLIVVHNDRLTHLMEEDASMEKAFETADSVVTQGILSVSKIINVPGEINVDLADMRTVLSIPGTALMAIGHGEGPRAAADAAEQALANPLLDIKMEGAKGILFSVEGGPTLGLRQVNDVGLTFSNAADKKARIFFGYMKPREEMGDNVNITVIATGIKQSK